MLVNNLLRHPAVPLHTRPRRQTTRALISIIVPSAVKDVRSVARLFSVSLFLSRDVKSQIASLKEKEVLERLPKLSSRFCKRALQK